MKLAQLQYFQAVCHYNSVTKAASALHVAQPSISAAIKDLEKEFGVNLFTRVKQRLILTSEGSFFLKYVNEILESTSSLEQKMLDLGQDRRHISIAVPSITGTFAFNPLYFAYRRRYPDAQMKIIESGSTKNLIAVADELVDLAIATTDAVVNEQLNVLPLKTVHIKFCVSPSHPLAKESEITFDMLRNEPLILFKRGSRRNKLIKERFSNLGIKPNVLLYCSQIHTVREFIESGYGGAFVFDGVSDLFNDLVLIPIANLPPQTVDLVWKKEKYLNNRQQYLFNEVAQFLSFARDYKAREANLNTKSCSSIEKKNSVG